jgi:hypothetical protein
MKATQTDSKRQTATEADIGRLQQHLTDSDFLCIIYLQNK